MLASRSLSAMPFPVVILFIWIISVNAAGQKKIQCSDGEHLEIDIKRITIRYDASSFAGTLSSLSALSGRMDVAPKQLQEAAVATQQWDVFLKGLAEGYNKCAVTRQQYYEGLNRIYPRLKQDAASLEEIRKAISDGRKIEIRYLQRVLDRYYANLRRFAQIANMTRHLERIEALSEQIKQGQDQLREQQTTSTELILTKLNEIQASITQAPLSTPKQVGSELSEIKQTLRERVDEAEAAYNKGFELFQRYRFQEAIPYLQRALAAVPLPAFYFALGKTYEALPDLAEAESILRKGLAVAEQGSDEKQEFAIAGQLGSILGDRGDLEGALSYSQRALKIAEKIYGPDRPEEANVDSNIGQILQAKGDLEGALSYTQRALKIDEEVYGPDNPEVAIFASNVGAVLQAKGDLKGALRYTQRALKIDENAYGPDHPNVAVRLNNIGTVLKAKGDLEGALTHMQRALKIDEKAYGPDHPNVAIRASNIGAILQDKGDLEGALSFTQRALKIDEKVYGPDHPSVAVCASNIGAILKAKGDLEGSLSYTQRALKIDEKVYGPDNPQVATDANNIGAILQARGDLDGALSYTQQALKINEKVYGPDHSNVAVCASNIGTILRDKGDLVGALNYTQRALTIFEKLYGQDNPSTKHVAANLKRIQDLMAQH